MRINQFDRGDPMFRIWCMLIGYAFGNLLSAVIVSKIASGRSPFDFGTGNPGMANVAHVLGIPCGAAVLAGDLGKMVLAAGLAVLLFPAHRVLAVLYTGLGAILGHNYPIWHVFRGGKGVAVTNAAIFLVHPLWGILANLIGLAAVLLTGWLPLGAVVIPLVFAVMTFFLYGPEAFILVFLYSIIMVIRHREGLVSIKNGTCPRIDPFAFLKKGKKNQL